MKLGDGRSTHGRGSGSGHGEGGRERAAFEGREGGRLSVTRLHMSRGSSRGRGQVQGQGQGLDLGLAPSIGSSSAVRRAGGRPLPREGGP